MKNSTNIKCFEPFIVLPSNLIYDDDLLCRWQWMTRDNKGWQGMTKVSCSAVKVCSMLCSGVTVAGQRRCYQLVCLDAVQVTRATFIRVSKNQPSSRPLAAIVSNCPLARQQTHNMLKIEYFLCLLHNHFLSGEGEDTTHIVWVCGQFMA